MRTAESRCPRAVRRGSVRDDAPLAGVVRHGAGGHDDPPSQLGQQLGGSSAHAARTTADQDALALQDRV